MEGDVRNWCSMAGFFGVFNFNGKKRTVLSADKNVFRNHILISKQPHAHHYATFVNKWHASSFLRHQFLRSSIEG